MRLVGKYQQLPVTDGKSQAGTLTDFTKATKEVNISKAEGLCSQPIDLPLLARRAYTDCCP